jgi:hypothetical protein
VKKQLNENIEEFRQKYENEKKKKEDLQVKQDQLENEILQLKSKIEEFTTAEVDVSAAKKKAFQELQNVKGQLLTEVQKLKKRLQQEQETRERLEQQYQELLEDRDQAVPIPTVPTPSAPSLSEKSVPPPLPTAAKPNIVRRECNNVWIILFTSSAANEGGLQAAITNAKLKKSDKVPFLKSKLILQPKEVNPMLRSSEAESVSNIIAFALLARRNDMQANENESDEEEEQPEWVD